MKYSLLVIVALSVAIFSDNQCDAPAVSIFKESRMWPLLSADAPFTFAEMYQFTAMEVSTTELEPLFFVPVALNKIRTYYSAESFTKDEITLINFVNLFFKKHFSSYTSADSATDVTSAQKTLCHFTEWLEILTQNDTTLARMIYTLDDGPFFGEVLKGESPKLQEITFKELPESNLRAGLYATEDSSIVFGIWDENNTALWQRYLTVQEGRKISFAQFGQTPPTLLPGYGYKVGMLADGNFGREYTHLYLTATGEFRFYYISW